MGDTWVDVSRGSGAVVSDGMRLNSDGVTVPPMRRHRESVGRQAGGRLAAVEAQAERIAVQAERLVGKVERLLKQKGWLAEVGSRCISDMLQEPEKGEDESAAPQDDG